MDALRLVPVSYLSAAVALAASALLLSLERAPAAAGHLAPSGARGLGSLVPPMVWLFVLVPLAAVVAAAPHGDPGWPALAIALVVAVLARIREDLLHSECGLKLMWVMVVALALSWAGLELLALATGTPVVREQWAVLRLGLEPPFLWSTALPLSLLLGLVLLGGAPFHFWAADLFQGARAWLAPLAVAALQVSGGGWIGRRLEGVQDFPPAAQVAGALLAIATLSALLVGSATLVLQRRPERRVGTLASLNGALLLAALAAANGGRTASHPHAPEMALWAAHLALALSGAGTLARFMPVSSPVPVSGPVLFRRHPWSGVIGLYAFFSLAGVPGTPGAQLWLGTARDLAGSGRPWLLIALAIAWLVAFSTAVRQLREAFGVRTAAEPPTQTVPWQARAALWVSGGALVLMAVMGRL